MKKQKKAEPLREVHDSDMIATMKAFIRIADSGDKKYVLGWMNRALLDAKSAQQSA